MWVSSSLPTLDDCVVRNVKLDFKHKDTFLVTAKLSGSSCLPTASDFIEILRHKILNQQYNAKNKPTRAFWNNLRGGR